MKSLRAKLSKCNQNKRSYRKL